MREVGSGSRYLLARLMVFLLILAFALVGSWYPTNARPWKPSRQAQAQDYLEILDQRGGNIIIVWWIASPMLPSNPSVQALFDKYVVIAALHAQIDSSAVASYTRIERLDVRDGNQHALGVVGEDKMPPALNGALATMGAALKQALGAFGEHVQYFVYNSGDASACKPGKVFVNYNGESYNYDTPIPGC